jgi:hypothetical protein
MIPCALIRAEAHMETILDEELPRSRLAVLLRHFSQIEDGRQSWRVALNAAASDLRNNRRLRRF